MTLAFSRSKVEKEPESVDSMVLQRRQPRALFIVPCAYTEGGLTIWLDNLDPGLRGLGWDVTIGLVSGPRYHRPQRYLALHPHQKSQAIYCQTGTPEGRMRAVESAIEAIAPDLVVTANLPDAVLAAARARQRSRPALKVAMVLHGYQPDLWCDLVASAGILDGVFCINRLGCRLVTQLGGIDARRVAYVPSGVACAGPPSPRGVGPSLCIALVARLSQDEKRVFDVPRILKELDKAGIPYELLIAGTGADEADLKTLMAEPIAAGKVCFLGFLSSDQLREQVLDRADVLLLTSGAETGPLVIWEAMACGVPVVSSRYVGSGLEAALQHDENALLFPIGDCQEAAAQLQRLWREPDLPNRLRAAGYRLIATRYSIPVSVANWDQALRMLLGQPPLVPVPRVSPRAASGRLDRWLGPPLAEDVRAWLRRKCPDGGPSGEWPHTLGITEGWDKYFWSLAKTLDQGGRDCI